MRRDIDTFLELCTALTVPKSSIASAARQIGVGTSSLHRWLRDSRMRPVDFSFNFKDEFRPLHEQVRRAQRMAHANFLAGDPAAPKPLRSRPVLPAPPKISPETESALVRDLRQRDESRKAGVVLPPIATPAPPTPQRHVSMDERAEGIGRGTVREGGMKVS
jgi:transposase-like protein